MGNESKGYNKLDGMEFVYKRAKSRTDRRAGNIAKVIKRRNARKAVRSRKRGN